MPPHREAQKKYCSRAFAAALVIGGSLIFAGHPSLGKGLIAGALCSIINFILIAQSLPYKLGKNRSRASVAALASIVLRFSLMAAPLVLAFKYHLFQPLAVAVGLFFIQIVIFLDHLVLALKPSTGKEA
jgi:hypothetical protein